MTRPRAGQCLPPRGLCLGWWLAGEHDSSEELFSWEACCVQNGSISCFFSPPFIKSLTELFVNLTTTKAQSPVTPQALTFCLFWSLINTIQSLGLATVKRSRERVSVSQRGPWPSRPRVLGCLLLQPAASRWSDNGGLSGSEGKAAEGTGHSVSPVPSPLLRNLMLHPSGGSTCRLSKNVNNKNSMKTQSGWRA